MALIRSGEAVDIVRNQLSAIADHYGAHHVDILVFPTALMVQAGDGESALDPRSAFWLLVPGAAGLIGVTAIVGTNSRLAPADFTATMVTVLAIALGVLIGTAAVRAGVEVRSRAISVASNARFIDRG